MRSGSPRRSWRRGALRPVTTGTCSSFPPLTIAVEDLLQAVADYCAWQSVVEETKPLALDGHQEKQATDRLADADHTVDLRLAETYQWLLVPRQPEPNGPVEWGTA